jgi:hypothetical protein
MEFFETKQIERLKAATAYSHLSIKYSFILNSGSAIAIITYIGHFKGNENAPSISNLSSAMAYFGMGTLLCVICGFCAYIAQYYLSKIKKKKRKRAKKWRLGSIIFGVSSLVCFMMGLYKAIVYFW